MSVHRARLRTHKGDGLKLLGAFVLAILSLFAAAFGLYIWMTADRPPQRDATTFCPIDGPRAITVMLIDTTDELPAPAKREVLTRLSDIAEMLPKYALLDIRLLDPAYISGRTIFALCNPGDGRGLSEFTGNPELAKRKWRELFQKPLLDALTGSLQPHKSQTSPLLATFQGIALDRFTGNAVAKLPKSLVIVSDMMELTREYSQYTGDLGYKRFRNSPAYLKLRTDLNGAEVQILYVQRVLTHPVDTVAHIQFWAEWTQDNRGQFVNAIRMQGAAK